MSETIETTVPACTMLLPRNLGALAKCCAKDRIGGLTMSGVQITRTADGYRACATDGRTLVMVDGPHEPPEDYPPIGALLSAPNSASSAIVNSADWTKSFRAIPKRGKPILQNVALVMGEHVTTLASTDLDRDNVTTPRNVEGRFPAVERVVPTGKPLASVHISAANLARVLDVASEYTADGMHGVILDVYADGKPIKVTTSNATGQRFVGLVVSLNVHERKAKHDLADMRCVCRTIAQLARIMCERAPHSRLGMRCRRAMTALTEKYMS